MRHRPPSLGTPAAAGAAQRPLDGSLIEVSESRAVASIYCHGLQPEQRGRPLLGVQLRNPAHGDLVQLTGHGGAVAAADHAGIRPEVVEGVLRQGPHSPRKRWSASSR